MSMSNFKKITLAALALVVAGLVGAGYYLFGPQAKDRMVVTDVVERIYNSDLKFSFAYKSGESALSSIESPLEETNDQGLLRMYVLMETKALNDYYVTSEESETPPAITVLVFERVAGDEATEDSTLEIEKIKQWAENNPLTSLALARTPVVDTLVDGIQAISYSADGLYLQDVYVVKYGDLMYLFVGQYLAEGDLLNVAFKEVMKSVLFD